MINNNNPNLFVAQTTYHIMLACEKYKKNDFLLCIGNIFDQKDVKKMIECYFGIDHTILTKNMDFYKNNKVELLRFRNILNNDVQLIRKIKFNSVFIYNDTDPVVQWVENKIKHNDVVLIEEGIGIYRNVVKRQRNFFKYLGKIFFGIYFEDIYRMGTSKPVTRIECTQPERLNVIQQKKEIFLKKELDFTTIADNIGIRRISSENWFLGQPLVEDGVLTKSEYMNQLRRILDYTKGEIIIKPHPRENLDKYSGMYVVRNSTTPIELMIDNSSPTHIYTMYSSAVLNLSKFKNVKCSVFCNTKKGQLVDNEIIKIFDNSGIAVVL